MTEREKLIELMAQADERCFDTKNCRECVGYGKGGKCGTHLYVDHLLSNGVIVPPCKVGDIVYAEGWLRGYGKNVVAYQITNIAITQNKKGEWTKKYRAMRFENGKTFDIQRNFSFEVLGETVFLTKEEAEKALKERSEGK